MAAYHKFGTRSRENLAGVLPWLVQVTERGLYVCRIDFSVVEGVRHQDRQDSLYAQGRTAPGKVVTWTKESKHTPPWERGEDLDDPDGEYGWAADLYPWVDGATSHDPEHYCLLARAMFQAAQETPGPFRLEWAGFWNAEQRDNPHWQVVRSAADG